MVVFNKKKIARKLSFGEKLKKRRHDIELSIGNIARRIRVDEKYLRMMEEDKVDITVGEIYWKKFVDKYCEFLKLDNELRNSKMDSSADVIPKWYEISRKIEKQNKINVVNVKNIYRVSIAGVFMLLLLFLGYSFRGLIIAPELSIELPEANSSFESGEVVTVSGITEQGVKVSVNNIETPVDTSGLFQESVTVYKGDSAIIIRAKRKNGKEKIIERQIIVN